MKLGLNVPNFGPGTNPEALAVWVRFGEDNGFDLAVVSDHIAVTPDVADLYPAPFYDPFTTIAWLAGVTERIELATSVVVLPYRNPLLTARLSLNLDQFSHGRFILGVGVGWSRQEYQALGVPFERRGAITDEYLDAITTLLTSEVATYEGEFTAFRDVHTAPRPTQYRHLPIWVGGSSEGALRRAVRFGDAWHPINAELSWLRETGLPGLREAAEAAERPVPAFSPRIRLNLTDDVSEQRRIGEGTLDQIVEDVQALVELGAEYVILDTNPDHPSQRRPAEVDWKMLETVVGAVSG